MAYIDSTNPVPSKVQFSDGANFDAFSRLRVSNPTGLWQAQLTYDLQPLVYEQVTAQSGATVTFNSVGRHAICAFDATPANGKAFLQSYEYIPYQPGKSQMAFVTFNFNGAAAGVTKFAGYSDGVNGVELQLTADELQLMLYSTTGEGNNRVEQSGWNIDKMDGSGPSGYTFNASMIQILVIDLQALYAGRVRVGFDIDGQIWYVHEFLHSNRVESPYIAQASLPVRFGMTGSGTTTMHCICASVISEGGQEDNGSYQMSIEGTGTAGNNARAHILSVRPNTTFNSIANRIKFALDSVDYYVTGTNPVKFELVIGQAISGTTAFIDVSAAYSGFEYNTLGTISGDPALVMMSAYNAASATVKSSVSRQFSTKYPITLDAAGAVRANGTISVIATGIGGTSACRAVLNWKEIR